MVQRHVSDPADNAPSTSAPADSEAPAAQTKSPPAKKARFARAVEAVADPAAPALPAAELLARLEAQAEKLSQARVRGRQLERLLRAQVERRERLEEELAQEREQSVQLRVELDGLEEEAGARDAAEREIAGLEITVQALERELESTRMQLEAVRGELASKRPLGQRLHPRSWR
jgi:predicted RNase H-like nuclease (RuvC/YqgF family)